MTVMERILTLFRQYEAELRIDETAIRNEPSVSRGNNGVIAAILTAAHVSHWDYKG